MTIDKKFIDKFLNVSSKAALASSYQIGKNNKNAADKAAVDSMRSELNKIDMTAEIVIGEGALDKAPMLFTGEILGTKEGDRFDIAVDPVEGTNFVAKNLPGAIAVLAVAEKNNLFKAPETYMDKIATCNIDKGLIDLDYPIEKNIKNLSEFKNKDFSSITACVLDRPRHRKIIDKLRDLNVNLKLISDGDVSGIIHVVNHKSPVDMYIGIGGGPEGVLAAAALSCYGGQIQTRLVLDKDEAIRAKKMGLNNLKKKYNLDDMIKGDVMFCATAITSGDLAEGIKDHGSFYEASTIALHKSAKINTLYKNKHIK